jgi:hypothetical protein
MDELPSFLTFASPVWAVPLPLIFEHCALVV